MRKLRGASWRRVALLSIALAFFAGPAAAAAPQPITVIGDSGGAGSGGKSDTLPDLFTGSLSHSVPIELPAGRKGMTPVVAVSYQQGNGNGPLGVGWELELGGIERSRRGTLDYSGNGFVLRTAGGGAIELVDVGGGEYRAKVEGEFRRIRKLTATDGRPCWEVTAKNGTRSTYGLAAATRLDNPADPNQIFRWNIERVEDTNGNYVSYSYVKVSGQSYPFQIAYAGSSTTAPPYLVRFWFNRVRTDVYTSYATNFPLLVDSVLSSIEVVNSLSYTRIGAYQFTYDISAETRRSRLSQVQRFGADAVLWSNGVVTGGTGLPATTFGYSSGALPSSTYSNGPVIWSDSNLTRAAIDVGRIMTGDFNGDGRTDILYIPGTAPAPIEIYLATATGFGPKILGPAYGVWDPLDLGRFKLADFNGDGKTDLAVVEWGPGVLPVSIYLSTGSGFQPRIAGPSLWVAGDAAGAAIDVQRVIPGDFNGDGMADLLIVDGTTSALPVKLYLSNGSGFATSPIMGPAYACSASWDPARFKLGDFNGDGKIDLAVVEWGNGWRNMSIHLSTGFGFLPPFPGPSTYVDSAPISLPLDIGRVMAGDFNGDGKTDLLYIPGGFTPLPIEVYISTGSGFLPKKLGPSYGAAGTWDLARFHLGDYNGDGKTDLAVVSWTSLQQMIVHLSSEDGFQPSVPAGPPVYVDGTAYYIDTNRVSTGDFNGDGRTDFAYIAHAGSWAPVRIHNSGGTVPDLLATVSNGIGATTSVAYAPSTAYSNTQLPFAKPVVSSITVNDGNMLSDTTSYSYSGGYFHTGERDFRGFGYAVTYGPRAAGGEQVVTETYFHQGNDTAPWTNNPAAPVGYMKGKPHVVRTWDAKTWGQYSDTITTYQAGGSAPYFNPASTITTALCEYSGGVSTCGRNTRIDFQYDAYGNVSREDNFGDVADPNDDQIVARAFNYNVAAWIVDKPSAEITYGQTAGSTPSVYQRISHVAYSYDGTPDPTNCSIGAGAYPPPRGNVTTVAKWIGWSQPVEADTRFGHDAFGNVVCVSDPDLRVTRYGYDALGMVQTTRTNALGHLTTTQYYGLDNVPSYPAAPGLLGQVKSVTDPNGAVTAMEYDVFGRKTRETQPDGGWIATSYTLGGVGTNRTETSSSLGAWSAEYFDGLNRPYYARTRATATGAIRASQTRRSTGGVITQATLPYFDGAETPRWQGTTYDSFGRPLVVTRTDGGRSSTCYRDLEGVTVTIDPNGHRKRETRDVRGNRVKVEEYQGVYSTCTTESGTPYATTLYTYDRMNRLTTVMDTASARWDFTYNAVGQKMSATDPDRGPMTYWYSASGDLTSQQDAKGARIYYQYDALHRLVLKDYPTGADVTYTYDDPAVPYAKGRLTRMTDGSGTASFAYDVMGRETTVTRVIDGVPYTSRTSYDGAGRVGSITYPDALSTTVNYQYDANGQLASVGTATATFAAFGGFNALGQVGSASFGNSTATVYQYRTDNNRLARVTTSGPSGTLLDLSYSYDTGGNITSLSDGVDPTRSQTLGYDGLDRLTSAYSPASGNLTYSYGATGNLLTKEGVAYTYGASRPHAVQSTTNGRSFTYDPNGNVIADGTRAFTYDYDDRPDSITVGSVTNFFTYDGNGQRVKKQSLAGTTLYVGKLYECTNGLCTLAIFAGDRRIATVTGGVQRYLHADHLGSTRVVTDGAGGLVERIHYKPYGEAVMDSSPAASHHKFTGQEYDTETGLYFYSARYYDPALGRFISPDPLVPDIDNPQALNRYAYVLGNPLGFTDPTGHGFFDAIGKFFGSRLGKFIVAGLIVVATVALVIATAGTGTPVAAAMAQSALVGELLGAAAGGYGAYQKVGWNWDAIASGVLFGTAVGGVTGAAAGYAGPAVTMAMGGAQSAVGATIGGAVGGAITGLGSGAAVGFRGGYGSLRGFVEDALLGALVGGAIGGGLGYLNQAMGTPDARVKDAFNKIELKGKIPEVGPLNPASAARPEIGPALRPPTLTDPIAIAEKVGGGILAPAGEHVGRIAVTYEILRQITVAAATPAFVARKDLIVQLLDGRMFKKQGKF